VVGWKFADAEFDRIKNSPTLGFVAEGGLRELRFKIDELYLVRLG